MLLRWSLHGQYQRLYDEPARDPPESLRRKDMAHPGSWICLVVVYAGTTLRDWSVANPLGRCSVAQTGEESAEWSWVVADTVRVRVRSVKGEKCLASWWDIGPAGSSCVDDMITYLFLG